MSNTRHDIRHNLFGCAMVLVFVLLPLGAGALDFAPDASRVVSDPAYLPPGAKLFCSTEYNYNQTSSSVENYLGAPLSANKTTIATITQVVEYGVTDDLSLRASDYYQLQGSTNYYPSGATTVTTSYGIGDPTFAAVWRVLDEKGFAFNWDLIGSYMPDLIDANSASSDQFGTVARGGSTAGLGTAISYKTKDFTVYLQGTALYLDSRDILNQTNGITTNYDSSWQYSLDLTTQTRFAGPFSLNAGVSQTLNDSPHVSFVNANGKLIEYINTPGDVTLMTFALNYQVVPGRFVASVIYSHDFYVDAGNDFTSSPKSDTTTNDRTTDVFGVEARYVFN